MNTDYARYRLESWGDWARERVGSGLGYPSMSVEQKAIFGRGGIPVMEENTLAEEIDFIVRHFDAEYREIAVLAFVRRWGYREIGKRLRCGKSTICRRIEDIVRRVAIHVS